MQASNPEFRRGLQEAADTIANVHPTADDSGKGTAFAQTGPTNLVEQRRLALAAEAADTTLALASAIALETFVPGFFSNAARQFRIRSLIGEFREQEQQEFTMKVEDVVAAQAPSPTNEALPPGGL